MKTTLARAAYWLDDYADTFTSCVISGDGSEWDNQSIRHRDEMRSLATQLKAIIGDYAARADRPAHVNAAEAVADILHRAALPAAVWFSPCRGRFKIAAEGYKPAAGEVLVGVYLHDATPEMLAEDFLDVMAP